MKAKEVYFTRELQNHHGGVVLVDLATRRLTRVSMPTQASFATEVRSGPGWIVTLGYGQNQRSTVRTYRIDTAR